MIATSTVPPASRRGPATSVALVAPPGLGEWRTGSILRSAGLHIAITAPGPRELELSEKVPPDVTVVVCGSALLERAATVRALIRLRPAAPLVAVVPSDSRRGVRSVLEAGAAGVVFDEDAVRTLVPTVRAVLVGQAVVPRAARLDVDRPVLSKREREVLGLVAEGLTNGQVAARLYLAESTVKCHLTSAYAKLGVRSRSEAVREVLDPRDPLGIRGMASAEGRPAAQAEPSPDR